MNYTQPTVEKLPSHERIRETINSHINREWPSVSDGESIADVAIKLATSYYSGFPVVSPEGHVLGFISEKDCLKYTLSEKYYHEPTQMVSHFMSRDVTVFHVNEDLMHCMESFIENPFHVYPVVNEKGIYMGAASRKELLRVALSLKESFWHEN